jgi:hypothetical protein
LVNLNRENPMTDYMDDCGCGCSGACGCGVGCCGD